MNYNPAIITHKKDPTKWNHFIYKLNTKLIGLTAILGSLLVLYLFISIINWSISRGFKYIGCGDCTFWEYLTDYQWPAIANWAKSLW